MSKRRRWLALKVEGFSQSPNRENYLAFLIIIKSTAFCPDSRLPTPDSRLPTPDSLKAN
ncbi:MAG: hypothetical protein F6K56_11835 [Moorea sp. SIO3G5]|nr:hypothetical protein [Moorena sp. SIO3G5]